MNKLRPNQMCPIHKRFDCCGRDAESTPAWWKKKKVRAVSRPGVRVIEDQFHPRGFRVLCSPAELRRIKFKLIADSAQKGCFYCNQPFEDFREIELCHVEPKGMGGARRDDHESNLVLGHFLCNRKNGSKRVA